MNSTPIFIGPVERAALRQIRERAAQHPVDMRGLKASLATPEGKAAHMRQMSAQTVTLPVAFTVTFSIEIGHPIGTARHMSMSVQRAGRLPSPEAVWMVAEELGYTGDLKLCTVWPEDLLGHGQAINVVQPVSAEASRA